MKLAIKLKATGRIGMERSARRYSWKSEVIFILKNFFDARRKHCKFHVRKTPQMKVGGARRFLKIFKIPDL
jgi:hypothetical protein